MLFRSARESLTATAVEIKLSKTEEPVVQHKIAIRHRVPGLLLRDDGVPGLSRVLKVGARRFDQLSETFIRYPEDICAQMHPKDGLSTQSEVEFRPSLESPGSSSRPRVLVLVGLTEKEMSEVDIVD